MDFLVTGAAGFIGRHLVQELVAWERRNTVCLFDPVYDPEDDARNEQRVAAALDRVKPDIVIHLAAKVGRLFGEDDVAETIADNAGMTATVAKACGERGIRLVYASTSEVYGNAGMMNCVDGLPGSSDWPAIRAGAFLPHNIYGLSKRWGEEVCRLYAPERLTIWRISMPYGPGLPAGRGRAAIINFLYNALHGQPITVHRGSERSWCWIGDTVRGMALTLEQPHGGTFNIGRDDNALPMRTVAAMACDLVDAPHDLIVEIDPPARQTVVKRLSTRRLRDLGWEPRVDLEEGMRITLDYVRELPAPEYAAAA